MTSDFDIDSFFSEQDHRMNLSDDDFDDYLTTRMATNRKSRKAVIPTSPLKTSTHTAKKDREAKFKKATKINSPFVQPELHIDIPEVEAPSNPISSFKRKQTEPSPELLPANKRGKIVVSSKKGQAVSTSTGIPNEKSIKMLPGNANTARTATVKFGHAIRNAASSSLTKPTNPSNTEEQDPPQVPTVLKRKVSPVDDSKSYPQKKITKGNSLRDTLSSSIEEIGPAIANSGKPKSFRSLRPTIKAPFTNKVTLGKRNVARISKSEARQSDQASQPVDPVPSLPSPIEDASDFLASKLAFLPQATSTQVELVASGPSSKPPSRKIADASPETPLRQVSTSSIEEISPLIASSRKPRSSRNLQTPNKVATIQKEYSPPPSDNPKTEQPPGKRKAHSNNPALPQVKLNKITEAPSLSSPVEDTSDILTSKSALSPEATSTRPGLATVPGPNLLQDVKRRVENHSSNRRRDNVIKIGPKIRLPDLANTSNVTTPGKSSVIYVPSSPSPSSDVPRSRSPALVSVAGPSKPNPRFKKPHPVKTEKTKATAKAKTVEKMTPKQYAQMLEDKISANNAIAKTKSRPIKFLKGKNIFYIGGEMQWASETTRGRMDIIVKYGGTLLPTYDPSLVTHIVTDATKMPTLRALGLQSLNQIPDHIPTVKWDWVISGIGRAPARGGEVRMDDLFLHAAFSDRIDAGLESWNTSASVLKGKGKETAQASRGNEEFSVISEFTQDKSRRQHPEPGSNAKGEDINRYEGRTVSLPHSSKDQFKPGGASSSKVKLDNHNTKEEDPLAEFYPLARAERDINWSRHGEVDESDLGSVQSDDEEFEPEPVPPRKRGFTCDHKEVQRKTCVNQDIVNKLQELMELHKSKPGEEHYFRALSYSKSIRAIRNHPKSIKSFAEARTIRGVGEKTALKIIEILQTGELRRIGYERTDDVKATHIFQGVYGVGPSTALKWYANGCRTLDDVKAGKGGIKLNPVQEIGIRFYDDINDRMPRDEAQAIFNLIKPIVLEIDPVLFVEIMGSFRRGKADCGDIDIIITRPLYDGKTHAGVLTRLLQKLHAVGILTEDLALPEDPDDLEAIYRGLCRLPKHGARRRRIDFLTVPWKSRGAALLYYTGDDIFNRAIRLKANVLGYSLNQKGLFGGVVRDPHNRLVKTNTGTMVASETEEEIFKILGVPWQEPHERVRG